MVIVAKDIPDGKPKSGRTWKVKQKSRASSQLRTGIQKILTKTYEERQVIKEQKQKVLELERNMKDETKLKRKGEILRQQERKKRLMEAEFKNTSYQAVSYIILAINRQLTLFLFMLL